MKKNTVKMFLAAIIMAGALKANAQTPEQRKQITKDYDKEALLKLANDLGSQAKLEKAEALRLAELNGWPITFVTDNGNFAELVGLYPDGKPKYFQTLNANAAFTSGVTSLNSGGSLGLNINGQNMLVGIWDQLRPRNEHLTFGVRLSPLDTATDMANHPTHVAGTIIGSGITSPNLNAKGMASESTGLSYDWFNDTSEMAFEASGGLLVSNHSYGSVAGQVAQQEWRWGAYGADARAYDQVAFAAKNYLIVQAAGNDRNEGFNPAKGGYDLINGSKTAKNTLIVAAVNGLSSAYSSPSQVVMSGFSSWGPSDDNRVKPDISAKGVNVISSVISGSSNTTYGSLSGTSMASPVVSGAAILLQQLYHEHNGSGAGTWMRAATLRGLIIHTADEAGPNDGPDPMFGWGLLDAKKAGEAIINEGTSSIIDERTLANNQTYSIFVNKQGPGPLQVSITWTDPAGTASNGGIDVSTPKLVNNLDLKVKQGDVIYYPWKLGASHDAPAEKAENNVDNVERVDINGAVGQYEIIVSHKNNITSGPQEYSLIVTGAQAVLGINDNILNLFSVWPNPANTELNIDLVAGTYVSASAEFYDVQGRVVLSSNLTQTQNAVNISNLSSGMYMVKVLQDGKQQVKKVVINK